MIAAVKEPQATRTKPAKRPSRAASFDLLRVPLVGRFLRWRWSRTVLQVPVLLLSLVMIGHAFFGPQLAPKNLGTLLTWVHFRGLVVIVLLLAGNLFCMACPFMLPRDLARRFFKPGRVWPRALRNKWLAIGMFVGVLFVYELFDLWSNPWWTGLLIVGYFAAALVVDMLFQGAAFCKYVCPVGQFNFLSSTLSPLEVAVRNPQTCVDCETKDCIRGTRGNEGASGGLSGPLARAADSAQRGSTSDRHQLPIVQRGCELALFQPRKVGNLDCTFCLDCVYACPHDNVGIIARLPAEELGADRTRSGIGRIERRFDFTTLAVIFTFGALLNAFAMISPVYALEQWMADVTGLRVEWPILATIFTVALVLEPALLMGGAALLTRRLAGVRDSALGVVNRFARSLLPIGFGVWLAHYGFHFFTGFLTVIPLTQHAVLQLAGTPILGEPAWQLGGLPESIVFAMELGFMGLGLIGSWMVAWAIGRNVAPGRAWAAALPWGLLHLLLFVAAVWIMSQPMDMRGTFLGG